jgi:hypothetical protein
MSGEMGHNMRKEFPLQPAVSDVTSLAVSDDDSDEFCSDKCKTVVIS